jgi:hypothetical protein
MGDFQPLFILVRFGRRAAGAHKPGSKKIYSGKMRGMAVAVFGREDGGNNADFLGRAVGVICGFIGGWVIDPSRK